MRLILDCEPEHLDEALSVAREAMPALARNPRLGWGWHYYRAPRRWWACSTKNGVSVRISPAERERS